MNKTIIVFLAVMLSGCSCEQDLPLDANANGEAVHWVVSCVNVEGYSGITRTEFVITTDQEPELETLVQQEPAGVLVVSVETAQELEELMKARGFFDWKPVDSGIADCPLRILTADIPLGKHEDIVPELFAGVTPEQERRIRAFDALTRDLHSLARSKGRLLRMSLWQRLKRQ